MSLCQRCQVLLAQGATVRQVAQDLGISQDLVRTMAGRPRPAPARPPADDATCQGCHLQSVCAPAA